MRTVDETPRGILISYAVNVDITNELKKAKDPNKLKDPPESEKATKTHVTVIKPSRVSHTSLVKTSENNDALGTNGRTGILHVR